jgi:hypothetical protein
MFFAARTTLPFSSAGLLIHSFDLPGVAILVSTGQRVASVWKMAALGAGVGIAVRAGSYAMDGNDDMSTALFKWVNAQHRVIAATCSHFSTVDTMVQGECWWDLQTSA